MQASTEWIADKEKSSDKSWRAYVKKLLAAYAPIGLLTLPLLGHRSSEAFLLGYSADYLLLLILVVIAGLLSSAFLLFVFRNAPDGRQLHFTWIMIGLVMAILLGIELWLGWSQQDAFARYRQWGHIRSPFYGFEAAPKHEWQQVGARYHTDENTFRIHLNSRPAPDEEILIVAIGGSSVFGYGLNDDQTWTHLLEEKLRQRIGPQVTVINAGMNGHNTLQQMMRLYIRILPLEPDYVLHYGLINDLRPDTQADQLINMPYRLSQVGGLREYVRMKNRGKGFYRRNSLLVNYAYERAERLLAGHVSAADSPGHDAGTEQAVPSFEKTTGMYLQNIAAMDMLCRRQGVTFIPVTFLADQTAFPEMQQSGMAAYLKALRNLCEEQDIPLLDLYPAYGRQGDPSLFHEDHYHPTPAGAEFIAEHLEELLVPVMSDNP